MILWKIQEKMQSIDIDHIYEGYKEIEKIGSIVSTLRC